MDYNAVIDAACDRHNIPLNRRDHNILCRDLPHYKEGYDIGYKGGEVPPDAPPLLEAAILTGRNDRRADVEFWFPLERALA